VSSEHITDGAVQGPQIAPLRETELPVAVAVIARGMRDNPTHVAAFGEDPIRREERLHRLFSHVLPVLDVSFLAARDSDGTVVGLLGMAAPGKCQPNARQRLAMMPGLLPLGPQVLFRSMQWMGAWAKQDPTAPHWHLGPVAVDSHLQGTGIGTRLMTAFCAHLDTAVGDSYLETDKAENVRFYQRFGFELVAEQDVIGVPNWFMSRRAEAA
jgi:GNAT superfamily N-acetyltransferase